MPRFAILIATACLLLTFIAYQSYERVYLAAILVATFLKFPYSHLNVISIPTNQELITQQSLFSNESDNSLVPAVVHQVLLGDLVMRSSWTDARSGCQELHPTWDFKLWRDKEANAFVLHTYPHLYDIYQAYPLEIQRSNVLRYLLLDHFGGMYFDLDLICHQPLDFLRNQTFLTPPANPTGVNNAFIVSTKGHPFWSHLIKHLPRYNVNWYTPYLTNMFSTGCHFFSTMHRTYPHQSSLSILDATHKLNGHVTTPLFEHLGASSWHKGDARVILQLGLFIEQLKRTSTMACFGLQFAVIFSLISLLLVYRRRQMQSRASKKARDIASWDMESRLC